MRYYGVVYDVGLRFAKEEGFSVEPFDPALVEYDMRVIAHDMHANAVRVEGEEISRLVAATRAAHAVGLSVFFNPWKMNVNIDETRLYLAEAAGAAEELTREGVDLVFVVGCEYSIFSDGIFPGNGWAERGAWLAAQFADASEIHASSGDLPASLRERSVKLNEVLRTHVETVKAAFNGPVTYSAGTWELVDWSMFDLVGVDYYRRGESADEYVNGLQRYRLGKPLGVLEFGCCAYEGAAARGDAGFMILQGKNPDGTGIFEGGVLPTRSEREQADYVGDQLALLAEAEVEAAFVYVFSFPSYTAGEGAKDMDLACFSLVKTFPKEDPRSDTMPPWVPKEAFHRAAEFFQQQRALIASAG